jgi:pyruvate formate-lyase/glycerol dehydratase family glycyl radical enzyme
MASRQPETVSPSDIVDAQTDAAAMLAVLNIQRTCVHDGPGIRTVVFFRGCRMRCRWCHNPEAQTFASPGEPRRSVIDLIGEIRRDRQYFATTHGGVTLSGGEPFLQPQAALLDLLEALKAEGVPVAIETAADAPWCTIQACLPYVGLFLVDLKAAHDDALHVRLTARRLRPVEDNIRRLVAAKANVRFRMCVVPGCNDSIESIDSVASLLRSLGHSSIELLRYFNLHERKVQRLGLAQEPLNISAAASVEGLERAAKAFSARGITARSPLDHAARSSAQFGERVHALQDAIRGSERYACIESARLKTQYYEAHGFDAPTPVHRAGALRYVLNRKSVVVHPHELIVGNFTSKRVGGNVWVEYFGAPMALLLWRIERQKPVAFQCSARDKLRFYRDVVPFWATRGLAAKVFPDVRELGLFAARTLDKKVGFNNNMAAIAHFIVNCERILRLGTTGLAEEVQAASAGASGNRAHFYEGVSIALRGLEEFADRYAAELRALGKKEPSASRRAELETMASVCSRVPRYPAQTLHEALQCILFLQIALCTESFENAISLGRLDTVLGPFYEADLAAGRIDADKARELIACFILKFDEIVILNDGDTGWKLGRLFESLSPVETVTVGGVDAEGRDVTNAVTYMILDACELRPIGVNMAARIHKGSPDAYVERISEVYLKGSPMPALYSDEAYIPALQNQYPATLQSVRNYSIVGCVEPVASHDHFANTDCANINVVLPFLQALKGDTRPLWKYGAFSHPEERVIRPLARLAARRSRWRGLTKPLMRGLARYTPPESLDALMERFQSRLVEVARDLLADHQRIERALARDFPTPLASSLFEGCIRRGKDVYEGGASINSSGIQAVGITDVADSLLALEEVVFKKRLYTLEEVLEAMDADFEGADHQQIRQALLAVPKFGDDASPEPHAWVNRVLRCYVEALKAIPHPSRNGQYVAGYYGLNVNLVYGKKTPSLPSGRVRGTPLANSICPHYGMQMVDLTSSLNSVSSVDFARYAPNGATLTSTIDAGLFPGEEGVKNLAGLVRGFFQRGGMQFQPNLVSREILLDAYEHPGKHKDLVVRIAGYCAYFDDLSDELKREILDRTYYAAAGGKAD